EIEEILRDAITQDGFMMLYQPMVDTRTGQIAAYEALLRLKDGQASPAEFIKIAEKNGMIIQIGRLVTQAVIKQMHLWKESGMDLKPVSINFSANQLQDIGYLDFLQEQLSLYQIAPQFLEIEITENILMENLQLTMQFLNKLREMGVAIAIDDFGTGFSSLNYLSFMPVNIVKLDRSLNLKFLEHDKLQVMESLISLVHSLGLTVVAEGIEKEEHVELLRQFGCDLIQGYYFSRPVPAEQIFTGTI
ncbi:MAG: EAL domain-containing protein, partial [Lachnospiraceae bacterium]|nr:EAL domain-containing protein [Lachnospiraceae bacterium]